MLYLPRHLHPHEQGQGLVEYALLLVLVSPDGQQTLKRPYGGPPEYAPRWALHHSLDLLRKL
jgi:hypothetical protein